MNSDTSPLADPLAKLCRGLDLGRLGDGNPVAGANVLVAMCASLCALESLEEGLEDPEANRRLTTGLSLLSSDPLTSRLLEQHVFRPLQELQGRHLANVGIIMRKRKHLERVAITKCVVPLSQLEEAKSFREKHIHRLAHQSWEQADFFKEDADDRRDRAFTHPRFLASSVGVTPLARELEAAHDARILAVLKFSRIEQVGPVDDLLNGILTGSHLPAVGDYSVPVFGHLIASVPDFMGQWIANPNGSAATWPNRMFWLAPKWLCSTDLDAAPSDDARFDVVTAFPKAAKVVLNNRLMGAACQTGKVEGLLSAHRSIRQQLRKLPGISPRYVELCTPLFATLYRGVELLSKVAGKWPDGFHEGLTELVLVLVRSSLRHQQELQGHSVMLSRRKLALQVYDKLPESGDPQTPRDIIRKGVKTKTAEVAALLAHLADLGLAIRQDDSWVRSDTPVAAARRLIETSNPIVEVDAFIS
ncbi:hypothetical protein KBB96_10330 [Luteolibacter ambystomatis]|uniref:Uncharacterized protein n=1 Tax=Luteolibacter ambystomatis TaxID=2824561 RepID=A0A975G6Q0_9BACT|nr:hypothetical protein [Luteolibacter ambystomatis]QUE49270.1 hypothetical protein KBB96_10330 [Luteolibacter ambystomatis]